MALLIQALTLLIALEHLWFLVLEMFLWRTPRGLKAFGMDQAKADTTAVLAANQGLYNGFLAAGLLWSLMATDPAWSRALGLFFGGCVLAAGIYGGRSVSRRIFFLQGLPALFLLIALLSSPPPNI